MRREQHNSIIGGMFALESWRDSQSTLPVFLTGTEIFLANARSGIWLLVNQLRPRHVWVPSYLCHTILQAVDTSVTRICFYETNYDLDIPSNGWLSRVIKGDLVLFIDYFGFSYNREYGYRVKEKGAWVLEDACQALLSSYVREPSDFVLFSLRKWIGVPDGAVMRIPKNSPLADISLEPPINAWWLRALRATMLRREFDDGLPSREWFRIFRETEDSSPTGPYAMSQLSQAILRHAVDFPLIEKTRIDNYKSLSALLAKYALFPSLGPDVVPLGFPVRVRRRDEIRNAMFDHEIYPPIHWLIDGVVPPHFEDSHRLAGDIMTLPCDQRYTGEDMRRIGEAFLKSVREDE